MAKRVYHDSRRAEILKPDDSRLPNRPNRAKIQGVLPELLLDDLLRLRKPHPCGSYEWKVVRLGADIGLECTGCGRRVLLPRRELSRRLKSILPKEADERPHE